jgi:hypothetical protein
MTLPLDPSNPPMETLPVGNLPQGEQRRYEASTNTPAAGAARDLLERDGYTKLAATGGTG